MRVRAYDSHTNTYFNSEVFAKINIGWYEKQLLLVPSDNGAHIKFIDYLDKSNPNAPNVLINTITPDAPSEWIYQRSGSVDKKLADFAELLDDDIRFFEYVGYPWIFDDKPLIIKLLNNGAVPLEDSIFENRVPDYKINGWNYIETMEDVNFLLSQTYSFHDSVLKEMKYVSGAYVDCDNNMRPTNSVSQITMRIDSQQCRAIEMIFEGVTAPIFLK